jgi:hypothetical protein
VVCDGGATNRSVWKESGITGIHYATVNSVAHPVALRSSDTTRRLFFFSDCVHLVKCICNNLLHRSLFQRCSITSSTFIVVYSQSRSNLLHRDRLRLIHRRKMYG